MKHRVVTLIAVHLILLLSGMVGARSAAAAIGIRVAGGRLVEANGTPLMLRGINHPHTWFSSQTTAFANIKATGANAIRVVLSGGRWQPANGAADVANVLNLCKVNRLICILENHDAASGATHAVQNLSFAGALRPRRSNVLWIQRHVERE